CSPCPSSPRCYAGPRPRLILSRATSARQLRDPPPDPPSTVGLEMSLKDIQPPPGHPIGLARPWKPFGKASLFIVKDWVTLPRAGMARPGFPTPGPGLWRILSDTLRPAWGQLWHTGDILRPGRRKMAPGPSPFGRAGG